MPMIPTKIDTPEVIQRAREWLARRIDAMTPIDTGYVVIMSYLGYCGALLGENLISGEVYHQLGEEAQQAISDRPGAPRISE